MPPTFCFQFLYFPLICHMESGLWIFIHSFKKHTLGRCQTLCRVLVMPFERRGMGPALRVVMGQTGTARNSVHLRNALRRGPRAEWSGGRWEGAPASALGHPWEFSQCCFHCARCWDLKVFTSEGTLSSFKMNENQFPRQAPGEKGTGEFVVRVKSQYNGYEVGRSEVHSRASEWFPWSEPHCGCGEAAWLQGSWGWRVEKPGGVEAVWRFGLYPIIRKRNYRRFLKLGIT